MIQFHAAKLRWQNSLTPPKMKQHSNTFRQPSYLFKASSTKYSHYTANEEALNKLFKKLINQKMFRSIWSIKWIVTKANIVSLIVEQRRTMSVSSLYIFVIHKTVECNRISLAKLYLFKLIIVFSPFSVRPNSENVHST